MKRLAVPAFWTLHLAVCLLFAASHAARTSKHPLLRALAVYGVYSGAANGYGFFSPVVPDARRMRVRVLCGDRWLDAAPHLHGSESDVRLGTIADLTMMDQFAPAVAASFAASAFSRFPAASAALVEVDFYDVPTPAGYRRGLRPEWTLLRVFSFLPPR